MENLFISLENLERFLKNLIKNNVEKEDGKGLSSNDLTDDLKLNYDKAYSHANSPHAPIHAQENVIEVIKINNVTIPSENKIVNLPVPKELGELSNDKGYLTEHPPIQLLSDTHQNITVNHGDIIRSIRDITKDNNGHIKAISSENITLPQPYTHPESGINVGTYRSVSVNPQGHIVNGTNPTTRDEYGLIDVPTTNEMNSAINIAIVNSGGLKREIVTSLPPSSSADVSTIYLILKSSSTENNIYNEYMVINSVWEKIGDTRVDLTGYINDDDLEEVTIAEIDALFV